MKYSKLNNYRTKVYISEGKRKVLLLVSGSRRYYSALRDAFRPYFFSRIFNDEYGNYDWGSYIYNISDKDWDEFNQQLCDLLNFFKEVVCIDDELDQAFALDFHTLPDYSGYRYTEMRDLVYAAKPYNRAVTEKVISKAKELSEHFIEFIRLHPSYLRANYIVAPPYLKATKSFDLPNFLAEQISVALNIENGCRYLTKIKKTDPMKNLTTVHEKTENIRGAFQLDAKAPFKGKRIILVDDIYETGTTLHEIATVLKWQGAEVLGLVATKTGRTPT